MIVELQIDADGFCKSFREQMRKALACELSEGVFDLNEADAVPGTRYVITGYTVGETTLRRAQNPVNVCIHGGAPNVVTPRPVRRPQVVQQLVVHVAWEHDLRAANTAKAPSIALTLPLVFELGMDTCGNMRLLWFHYIGLDASVDQAMAAKLGQKIKSVATWLPVDQVIAGYMPADVTLINSHLTMTESHKCFAVRMEFWEAKWGAATGDSPRSVAEWDLFYNGHVIDRLQRGNVRDGWSIFVDSRALTHFVRKTILDSIGGSPGLTITRQPKSRWYHWYPEETDIANRVRVDLEVEKKDACWCFTEDLDIEAEIEADVVISVPKEDTLRIDVYVDISLDGWDATCCVLTAAIFWPVLGLGQAIKGKIDAGMYWLGFLPFAALIGAIVAMDEETSKFPPPGGFVTDPDDETHAWREEKLNLPNSPSFGRMTLRGTHPVEDHVTLKASGLYLYGGLETFSPPQPELENPRLDPFCWGKAGRCSRRIAASTQFRLYTVNPQHWALLHVCEVRVLDDPLGVFKVEVTRELHGMPDVKVSVDFWAMNGGYWKSPYPCRLMVKTSGGVRILTLPPLPALTEEQFQSLHLGAQLEYVNDCYLPRHRLFEELEWPIEVLIEQPGLHHWQVRAVGLHPGEQVQLVDERGATVARFTVSRHGMLTVNALGVLRGSEQAPIFKLRRTQAAAPAMLARSLPMPPASDPNDAGAGTVRQMMQYSTRPICGPSGAGSFEEMVKIRGIKFADLVAQHRHSSREVIIRQALLEERRHIPLAGECLSLSLDSAEGWSRLVVVTQGMVEAYDISDTTAPRRAGAWRAEGVRGSIAFGERLLLWGDRGIWVAGEQPPAAPRFSRCDENAVRGAAVAGGKLYVLRAGEIRVHGPELCEQGRHPCQATQIAAAGGQIILADAEGLRVLDSDRCSQEPPVFHPVRGVTRLEAPAIPLRNAVYARTAEGGLYFTPSGECLAEYEGGAWTEGFVRAGRLLASIDGNSVRLLEIARTVQNK